MNPEPTSHARLAPLIEERRQKRRARIRQPVRVRPSEPMAIDFDEVCPTINVSREGLYFSTERRAYRKDLRLFVTCPYNQHQGAFNCEYVGTVVRVDPLPHDRVGVAVHLLMTINLQGSNGR